MDALQLLLGRNSALRLEEPGPSETELDIIFKSALRAPDHGKLRPWRFVLIQGDKRKRFGEILARLLEARNPTASIEMLDRERQKAVRAPLIVVTVARIKQTSKIPETEQLLSAGAAAQNIMLAVHALGYGAMWRTGVCVYDLELKKSLHLEPSDAITGLIYIGTRVDVPSAPVSRPAPMDFVDSWQG